jgi:hypothetical protein
MSPRAEPSRITGSRGCGAIARVFFDRSPTEQSPNRKVLEAEPDAEDRAAHLDVEYEAVILVIDMQMPVPRPHPEPVLDLIPHRAADLPGQVRSQAEAADIGEGGEEKAPSEIDTPALSDHRICPELVVIGASGRQQPGR